MNREVAESEVADGEWGGDWGVRACGQRLYATVQGTHCALDSNATSNLPDHQLLTDLIEISILQFSNPTH